MPRRKNLETRGSKKLDEDARLRSAQADLRTLELQRARREVVTAAEVEKVLVDVESLHRARLLGLGARVSGVAEGRKAVEIKKLVDAEAIAILQDVVDGLRKLAASIEPRSRGKRAARPKNARRLG